MSGARERTSAAAAIADHGTDGATALYPRPRSGRRDLDWGVQILVFEVDRGVLRQFEIQVVFLGKFLNFFRGIQVVFTTMM